MFNKGDVVEFKSNIMSKYYPILGEDVYGTYTIELVGKHGGLVLILLCDFVPTSTKSVEETLVIKADDLKNVSRLKKIERLIGNDKKR